MAENLSLLGEQPGTPCLPGSWGNAGTIVPRSERAEGDKRERLPKEEITGLNIFAGG
jgi:hypothetical protein